MKTKNQNWPDKGLIKNMNIFFVVLIMSLFLLSCFACAEQANSNQDFLQEKVERFLSRRSTSSETKPTQQDEHIIASKVSNQSPGLKDNKIVFQGMTRSFIYYVPPNLPLAPVPMVFVFHGYGSDSARTAGIDENTRNRPNKGWKHVADQNKFIVVYPEALINAKKKRGWNDCRGLEDNGYQDDVGFVRTIINYMTSNLNIDQQRIYATGISCGGHMSIRLALESSDKIAAIGAIAAAMPTKGTCSKPQNPVSVLFMNGTNDFILPFKGGRMRGHRGTVLSAAETIEYWKKFLKTNADPITEYRKDVTPEDGSTVKIDSYLNGTQGTSVVFYMIKGGGHSTPSVETPIKSKRRWTQRIILQNRDIEASAEIWNFFSKHTLNQ